MSFWNFYNNLSSVEPLSMSVRISSLLMTDENDHKKVRFHHMKSHQLIKSVRTSIILNERFLDSFWWRDRTCTSQLDIKCSSIFQLNCPINILGWGGTLHEKHGENILIVRNAKSNIFNF